VVLPVPPFSDRTAIVSAIEDGHDTGRVEPDSGPIRYSTVVVPDAATVAPTAIVSR
jgi:hypothetical protein